MTSSSMTTRRLVIVIAVLASLTMGLGAIRAAAAWTAAAAPLSVSPSSADTLQARLADEAARSSALQSDLADLTKHADDLAAALEAAQARIDADAAHATALAKDLATAKSKLAALERSIRQAARVSTVRFAAPVATTRSSSSSDHDDEDEESGDD